MYPRLKLILLCVLAAFAAASAYAGGTDVRFVHLSNENGLPGNMVHKICQDHKGFIWLGTDNGLCKYDGNTVTVYDPSPQDDDRHGLPSKRILNLFEDSQRRLWVMTARGVRYYDRSKDHFVALGNDSLSFGSRTICQTSDGTLYMDAGDKLRCYDSWANRIEPVLIDERDIRERFSAMVADPGDRLWIGTKTNGLVRVDLRLRTVERYRSNSSSRAWLCSNRITTLYRDRGGWIWIGTEDKGWCCYDTGKDRFFIPDDFPEVCVFSFCEDAAGNMWIGSDKGLYIYDPRTRRTVAHQVKSYSDKNSLSDNSISTIFRDREDNILLGTHFGGVNIFPSLFRQFSYYDWGEGEAHLSGRIVRQIINDGDDNLWIATEDGNLNYLDRTTMRIRHTDVPGTEHMNPYSLLLDSRRRLWVGTKFNGLFRFSPTGKNFVRFTAEEYPGISVNNILSLIEDRDGTVWVGTASGLSVYDEKKEIFIQFDPQRFRKESIDHLMMDSSGNVWIATRQKGLHCYNREKKRIRTINTASGPNTVSDNYINYIFEDSKGNLWIGTNDGGLNRYNVDSRTFDWFTTRQYLPSNTVYSIIEDDNGNIWLSTDNGLSCYDTRGGVFTNYSTSEGLPNRQFNNNSVSKDSHGYLYFGTIDGMVSFHPDSLQVAGGEAKVEFTELRVLGKAIKPSEDSPLRENIESASTIRLNSAQAKSFSLSYTIPTISHASSLFFSTRLSGDQQWNFVGAQNQMNFANLPAGEYTLRIKASYNNRWQGNEPVSTIRIVVEPPVWRSGLAYAIYALAVLALAWQVYGYLHRRQRRRSQALMEKLEKESAEELNRLRMNFFTNISHQLRIPLSLIIGPLESMISKGQFTGDVERKMQQLSRNASKMKTQLDELLLFTKVKSGQGKIRVRQGDIQGFIYDIALGFRVLAEEKELELVIDVPRTGEQAWFSLTSVEKIVYNLLSNAFKYTERGSITIRSGIVERDGFKILQLSVADTGIGIDSLLQQKIFENYYQVNDYIRSRKSGFGIGLSLTKELAEQHQGRIWVESRVGAGSEFLVELGIGRDSFADDEVSPNRADEAFMDEYEFMPVESRKEAGPATESPAKRDKKHTILVVEDEAELLRFYKEIFSGEYNVLTADNGEKGLKIAARHLPDVVVSDVMMPVMNGYELSAGLKNDIATSHINIVLLTAKTGREAQLEGYDAGADIYIEKPFHPSVLQKQIANLLTSREKLKKRYMSGQIGITDVASSKKDVGFLTTIDRIIKENISNEHLSVDDLTRQAAVSRTQLHTKLKALVGMSATQYINHIRLREATLHLISDKRVSEAAYATGFSSPSYFTRCFRKQYGISPVDYKEYIRKQQAADH